VVHNTLLDVYPIASSLTLPYKDLFFRTVEHLYQYLKIVQALGDEDYARASFPTTTPDRHVTAATAKSLGSRKAYRQHVLNTPKHPFSVKFPTKKAMDSHIKERMKWWETIDKDTGTRPNREAMMLALALKYCFKSHPRLAKALIDTGRRSLGETGRGRGTWLWRGGNLMGECLMETRQKLIVDMGN